MAGSLNDLAIDLDELGPERGAELDEQAQAMRRQLTER
jgi:hypothetical protein